MPGRGRKYKEIRSRIPRRAITYLLSASYLFPPRFRNRIKRASNRETRIRLECVAQVPAISLIFRDILFSRTERERNLRVIRLFLAQTSPRPAPLFLLFLFLFLFDSRKSSSRMTRGALRAGIYPAHPVLAPCLYPDPDGSPVRVDLFSVMSGSRGLVSSVIRIVKDTIIRNHFASRYRFEHHVLASLRVKSRGIKNLNGLIMLELSVKRRIQLIQAQCAEGTIQ